MENQIENEVEEIELDLIDGLETDDDVIDIDSPDVELDGETIEKINRMFDAGSTRSTIAKELALDRVDVIEVLSKHVLRNKINGKNTQEVQVKSSIVGKIRIPLGDRLNSSIYMSKDATPEQIDAAKKKWLRIINNKND